jgi:hypothetical protein
VIALGPTPVPTPLPTGSRGIDALGVVELVLAAVLALMGVRSLVRWVRRGYRPASTGESILYALHVTARVGLWFAFAGFFAGYALIDEPQGLRWYVLVPLGLAAIQLLTALALGMGKPPAAGTGDRRSG